MSDTGNVVPIDRRRTSPEWLGPLVREIRVSRGWSLRELARRSGVSRPHIWAIEEGTRTPSVRTARALADALSLCDDHKAALLDVAAPDRARD